MHKVTLAFALHLIALPGMADAPDRRDDVHIFLANESVAMAAPAEWRSEAVQVRAVNERFEEVARVALSSEIVDFGALPVGWYRVEFLGADGDVLGFTTAAVLARLAVPPPADTPIAIDVALSWLSAEDQRNWPVYAELARLAGVRWVRDRIHWREMQREDGSFIEHTKYDDSAAIQSGAELQILQVFHTRPRWALAPAPDRARPRLDLAKLYAFCKGMAERFEGQVQAWEPWNEGNAGNFGGYTLDELCALQKAAYLGFRAGDHDVTVCWNPLGGINIETQTDSILRNETWPYYDVYSIHSYDWPHGYEQYWTHARETACGKPIWVTECDRGMQADPDSAMGDFTPAYDRRKAELVVQSYVRSLFSGSDRHFHFILGHYMENENRTQFGLLRRDLTPRPGYVALAALGRLIAGGACLGRYEIADQPNVHVYAFRAEPDGQPRDVIVAWTEREGDWPVRGEARAAWPVAESLSVQAAYDYLGRPLDAAPPDELRPDAVFLVLPEGEADKLTLRTVPPSAEREGEASPVVLQFHAPGTPPVQRTIGWSPEAAYEFAPGTTVDATLTVYNLGESAVSGDIVLDPLPDGWKSSATSWSVELDSMAQATFPVQIVIADDATTGDARLDFRGHFGDVDQPVFSVWSRKPPE